MPEKSESELEVLRDTGEAKRFEMELKKQMECFLCFF